MQGRFKMEYRLFTIVRYNYNYRDYNRIFVIFHCSTGLSGQRKEVEEVDPIPYPPQVPSSTVATSPLTKGFSLDK